MLHDVWSAQRTARMLVFSLRQGAFSLCLQPVGLVALPSPLFEDIYLNVPSRASCSPVFCTFYASTMSPNYLASSAFNTLLTLSSLLPFVTATCYYPESSTTTQIYLSSNTTTSSAHSACRAQGDTYRVQVIVSAVLLPLTAGLVPIAPGTLLSSARSAYTDTAVHSFSAVDHCPFTKGSAIRQWCFGGHKGSSCDGTF